MSQELRDLEELARNGDPVARQQAAEEELRLREEGAA